MKKYFGLLAIVLILSSCSTDADDNLPQPEEETFSSEIFFSEYIEGNSFNKALEIVNLTGEIVNFDDANYTIRKQSNGDGDWMGEVALTGSVAHTGVFVIANASADPDILEIANQTKTGAPMDFNGNDPVGLFKDGELIDVIGEVDSAEDFGMDVTLRRKKSVTEPSPAFDIDEWEIFEVDTIDDLGEY